MSHIETLKEQIIAAVDAESSESVLEQVNALLHRNIPMATEEEEAGIAEGIADIEAGHYYTLEEFMELTLEDEKALIEKYKDRDAR